MKRALAYAAIYLLWGASFLAIREVVSVCPPFFAAGLRFLLAGILLFGYVLFRRMALPTTQQWKGIVFLGLLFFVGDYGPLFWGEQRVPSGEAAVIAATIPTDVFLLEWLVLRRVRPNWLSMVGAVLGLAGVASLVALSPATNAPQAHGLNFAVDRYSIALVLAAISWSVATVCSSRFALPKERPVSASLQMMVGGIGLLFLSVLFGEARRLSPAVLQPRAVGGMVYLVVFASIAAFSAYIYLLSSEPASRVASYAYINPIVALGLGAWLAGERLTAMQGLASGVVIVGTAATLLGRSRQNAHS